MRGRGKQHRRLPIQVLKGLRKWVRGEDRRPVQAARGKMKVTIQPWRVYSAAEDRWYTAEEWRKKNG